MRINKNASVETTQPFICVSEKSAILTFTRVTESLDIQRTVQENSLTLLRSQGKAKTCHVLAAVAIFQPDLWSLDLKAPLHALPSDCGFFHYLVHPS